MKGASVHNNSRSQSQVLSVVSRQRTDTGILKRRKFFDTFKVSRQMTPYVSETTQAVQLLCNYMYVSETTQAVQLLCNYISKR